MTGSGDEGHTRCVGSLAELSELSGTDVTDVDPHRPSIDEVTFPCPDCADGTDMRRVEPVIDAWFDSGSMPTAQWGYPGAPGSAESFVFPADFICEAIDQTRGWFYSLLAVNTLVRGATPYRNVLCLGHIVDALLAHDKVGSGLLDLVYHALQDAVLLVEELLHLVGVVDSDLCAELGLLDLQGRVDECYLGTLYLLRHRRVNYLLVQGDPRDELGVYHRAAGLLRRRVDRQHGDAPPRRDA